MSYWYVSNRPATYPVDLDEAKAHLRIDGNESDSVLMGYIATATDQVEALIGPIVSQTITQVEDKWPAGDRIILLAYRPSEVVGITYRLSTGTTMDLDPSVYAVDLLGPYPCLYLIPGESWPSEELWPVSPISVVYKAGWLPEEVPDRVRHAILLLVGLYDANREAAVYSATGGSYSDTPWAVLQLLADYRWGRR